MELQEEGSPIDPTTMEVLKKMKAQGYDIEGEKKAEPEAVAEPVEEAKPQEPEPQAETPKEEEPEAPVTEQPKAPEREPRSVPVKKYNELRHELQELKKAQELRATQTPAPQQTSDTTKKLEEVAEQYGASPEVLKALYETIKADVVKPAIPDDIQETIKQFREVTQQQAQELGFKNEFSTVAKEFPQLSGLESTLKELAFTEGNERIPLRTLAIQHMHDEGLFEKGRKTAESSRPTQTGKTTQIIDYEDMDEEKFLALPAEKRQEYLDFQAKKEWNS